MSDSEKTFQFKAKDFKGSRFRCLQLTSLPMVQLKNALSEIIAPYAELSDSLQVSPRGFLQSQEIILTKINSFVSEEIREELKHWWLDSGEKSPNWDIVANCQVNGKECLMLVEAKAYKGEFKVQGDPTSASGRNREHIRAAIENSNNQLAQSTYTNSSDWNLNITECYQLSNRLAWTWKLASLGIPTILVYLGCLNCSEWSDAYSSHEDWERHILTASQAIVPQSIWNQSWQANGTTFAPLIRSLDINIQSHS